MVKPLVFSKTQTVKEIKTISNKRRKGKILLKLFFIIIIVVLLAFIINKISIENRYSFTDKQTNIHFSSKDFHLKEGFEIFSKDQNYLVVFNTLENDSNYLSQVTDGLVYVQSMLFAKNKSTILLISTSDENKNLLYCQSNLGDIYENKELTVEECLELINNDYSTIFVDYAYPEYVSSEVTLNLAEKLLSIKPMSSKDAYYSLVISINYMFKDAHLIEQNLGDIQERIKNIS